MEKEEVVKKLNENDIDAGIEDGFLYVYDNPSKISKIRKLLRDMGYNSSFGVKLRKNNE